MVKDRRPWRCCRWPADRSCTARAQSDDNRSEVCSLLNERVQRCKCTAMRACVDADTINTLTRGIPVSPVTSMDKKCGTSIPTRMELTVSGLTMMLSWLR